MALLAASFAAAQEQPTVGGLGSLRDVRWQGVESFDPEEIATRLVDAPDYLKAAASDRPLAGLLAFLDERIELGYRAAGFADVEVSVAAEDAGAPGGQRLRIEVAEGRRYTAAEIAVTGCSAVPAERIRTALVTPRETTKWYRGLTEPEVSRAVFEAGTAPELSPGTLETRAWERVVAAYRDAGHLGVKGRASWRKSDDGGVTLDVAIDDEGRRVEVRSVGVKGDDEADVLALLGNPVGTSWNTEREEEWRTALHRSGRYYDVGLGIDEGGVLHVELRKAGFAPAFADTPGEVFATLQRAANWLPRFLDGGGAIQVEVRDLDVGGPDPLSVDAWFSAANGTIVRTPFLVLALRGGVLRAVLHAWQLDLEAELCAFNPVVDLRNDTEDDQYWFFYGLTVHARRLDSSIRFRSTAPALLRMATTGEPRSADGKLHVSASGADVTVDEATGAWTLDLGDGATCRFVEGGIGRAFTELGEERRGLVRLDVLDAGANELAAAALAVARRELSFEPGAGSVDAARKLAALVLARLRPHSQGAVPGPALPAFPAVDDRSGPSEPVTSTTVLMLVGMAMLRRLGREFEPGSWPHVLCWYGPAAALPVDRETRSLCRNAISAAYTHGQFGPIAWLAITQLFDSFGQSTAARWFATRARLHCTLRDAWRDVEALIPEQPARDELIAALGALLRAMRSDGAFGDSFGAELDALGPDANGVEVVHVAARWLWSHGARDALHDRLTVLARPK